MTTTIPSASEVSRAEHRQASRVLAASFADDPLWRALRPRRRRRADLALYWIFRCEITIARALGGYLLAARDTDRHITAVVIAYSRSRPGFPWWTALLRIPAMVLLGPGRTFRAARMALAAEAHQPDYPHVYGFYAGSTTLGGGAALLKRLMRIAERAGLPAYGEAKSLESREIMRILGWRMSEPIDIGDDRQLTPARWDPPNHSAPARPSENGTSMIDRLAGIASRAPKAVLAFIGIAFVVLGVLGAPVAERLSAGGFIGSEAESARATAILERDFGLSGMQLVLAVESDSGALGAAADERANRIVTELRADPRIQAVLSPWTEPLARATLVSDDGRIGLIVATVRGGDDSAPATAHEVAERYTGSEGGVEVRAGGQSILFHDANTQAARDLLLAEAVALPLCFLLLVWFLRSAIAAAIPIIVGMVAIVGTTAILYALTFVVELSVFALNLTTAIGLALAIDYSLLLISRYREEVARGSAPPDAIAVAMRRGGRAVVYAGATVAIGIVGMVFFPMPFLRSIAYAGVAVVTLTVLLALIMVPALLTVLGERINRKPLREATAVEQTRLYRTARAIQRRPLLVAVPIVALLLALGAPVLGLRLGLPDDRVLPATAAAHQVGDDLRERFSDNPTGAVQIVVTGDRVDDAAALADYSAEVSRVAGVSGVVGPTGAYAGGLRVADGDTAMAGQRSAYLTLSTTSDPYSTQARDQLDALHAVPAPGDTAFGGLAQQTRDTASGISQAFPLALAWIAVVTFVLLLLLTGSVLLPLKALVLNTLSLSATFGAMVWIFQDGHLGGLGTVAPGYIAATVPALVFCTAFGLSMDYEIFLLTRFKEEWDNSARSRADNDTAVAVGLARSGRVITAAAVLMTVVFSAVITSDLSLMRMFGLGLTLAVVVDATLVRMLLVPAFMRLLGTGNWWAPAWSRPTLERLALRE
ncbi:MMPL family transporter [Nocardia mangyaensis]|uniref:MMPL family transporter n=1 Tax=Nocardia mangyaensis TaxID=2213200 RepID=UPI0026775AF0|nr:MMPL family transporter [Nocardia mangyaensis]MDO3647921.1 MMPL family transporter [Nocardia mangyaensis]